MRVDYREYLKSPYWKAIRRRALIAAGHRCQICHKTDKLEVHHVTYERLGHERPEDLLALCGRCHAEQHDLPYIPRANAYEGQPEAVTPILGRVLSELAYTLERRGAA